MNAPDIAQIAADEYHRRLRYARHAVAQNAWTLARAEAEMRPWAAIACRAGAQIEALAAAIVDHRLIITFPGRVPAQQSEAEARADLAETLATRAEIVAALSQAREALIRKHAADPTEPNLTRARAMLALARWFAVPLTAPNAATPERLAA